MLKWPLHLERLPPLRCCKDLCKSPRAPATAAAQFHNCEPRAWRSWHAVVARMHYVSQCIVLMNAALGFDGER